MKKSLLSILILTSLSSYASYQHQNFLPLIDNQTKHFYQSETSLEKGTYPLTFNKAEQCYQPQAAIKLNQTIGLIPCEGEAPQIRLFRAGQYIAEIDERSGTPTLRISVKPQVVEQGSLAKNRCEALTTWNGKPVEIDVSQTFSEGEQVREFYSGKTAIVKNGTVTFTPDPQAQGLMLLEKANSPKAQFDWKNATVYFVLTDRFENGDPSNDNSYGRQKDGMQEIGTFHGGDLKGLTSKLDYLADLGINAIWISSPLEQIHGWVGGGEKGDFPHYAYHGYYHQDWTKVDANMGTESDLAEFVQQAHQRGIRVLFDIVLNHTGYATLADMQEYGFGAFYLKPEEQQQILGEKWTNWKPQAGQNWHSFNDYIKFSDKQGWATWWGKDWTRSDIGDYDSPKFDDLRMSLSSLPDLKTESESAVKIPEFLQRKAERGESAVSNLQDFKVRQYLIKWLSDWVEKYGIDGFRVDTAKHVEKSTWLELKQAAQAALQKWQTNHPTQGFNDQFWMTGEAWGHGVHQSDYFKNGFDAMINFDFQQQAKDNLACFANIADTYQEMSEKLQGFNVLSYLSSHDTELFMQKGSQNDLGKQKIAGSLLMLAPGAVQIYYGDESGRQFGATGSDPIQGTRSDMNWQELQSAVENQELLQHWQKLSAFRQKHNAIGAGSQKILTKEKANYFAFERSDKEDKVMVVWLKE